MANETKWTPAELESAAKAAAKWWADRLRSPGLPSNGDASGAGGMVAILGALTQRPQSAEALTKFETLLAARITQELAKGHGLWLGVDYHPDALLADAARDAGLTPGMGDWPWKTHMDVRPECVRVAPGYRAELQTIHGVALAKAEGK